MDHNQNENINKRVVVTGHTSGIGNALFTVFENNGFRVEGYSRSNGYDISDPASREEIILKSLDADIFVNNAFDFTGQLILLEEMTARWQGTDKLIINLGSKGVHIPIIAPHEEYLCAKRKQHEFIKSRFLKGSPHILNVVGGIVDTDMNKQWNVEKIKTIDFAEMIYFLATSKISVQEVMLDVPGIDWEESFWKSQ